MTERDEAAIDTPELVNSAPYGEGWLIRVRMAHATELENLLFAADYEQLIREAH